MTQLNQTCSEEENGTHWFPPFLLVILDFILVNISFFSINYWKRGTFALSSGYFRLLVAFYLIWILISLFTNKFRFRWCTSYWDSLFFYFKTGLYAAYCSAFLVVMIGLPEFSRIHVFGTWALLAIQEGLIFSFYYVAVGKPKIVYQAKGKKSGPKDNFSKFLFISDFGLVGISFFLVNYLKRGHLYLLPEYEKLLLLICGLWFVTSFATGKFIQKSYRNYYHALWPWFKTIVLLTAAMSFVIFALRLFYFSRTQVFGTILLLGSLEGVVYGLYFIIGRNNKNSRDIESAEEVNAILRQEELPLEVDIAKIRRFLLEPVRMSLKEKYFNNYPDLFDLVDQSINLSDIVQAETAILNSNNIFNLATLNGQPVRLFINLSKVNDIRWINRYLLEVHKILMNGGYFLGKVHTIATRRKFLFKKYPKQIAKGILAIDFFVNRILPKLPLTKRVYFAITKGKNRIISKAEILGRLFFCGFDIVAEKEIYDRFWFLARKVKTPSTDQSPSYGPLVEFKRIGTNNELIHTYKFRTMFPYSEFLQDYVYAKKGLREGGKIKDDFRVTVWGKFLRKIWLDELPMVYNWVKGDLQLVGVRPISAHYLSLYDKVLRDLRQKVKPGLIPPFYADMPTTFEEICESEKRYIGAYLEHPFRTQLVYFGKAIYNIVIKGARSS